METPKDLVSRSEFLRLLPEDMQAQVVDKLSEQQFKFGDRIVAEGDPADAYFFILSGKARVVKATPDGGEVPLDALKTGDSFGEIGLLTGGSRTATVRATGAMSVLRLDRGDFESILEGHPSVRAFIQEQLQSRQVQGFLRQYTEFGGAPMEAMEALLEGLESIQVGAEQLIFSQGDEPDGMYIIENGHVRIFLEEDGHQRDLAFLRPGDFFGELSLLAGNPRAASAEAASDCQLLKLAPREYGRLMDRFPQLRVVVEKRMASYRDASDPGAAARMPLDFWRATQSPEPPPPAPTETLRQTLTTNYEDTTELTATFEVVQSNAGTEFSRRHFVQQLDEQDSAAACLTMLALHCGIITNNSRIGALIAERMQKQNAASEAVRDVATEIGLRLHSGQGDPGRLDKLALPCLMLMKDDKWVLLIDLADNRVRVADPGAGISWLHQDKFAADWSRMFLEADADSLAAAHPPGFWTWATPVLSKRISLLVLAIFATVIAAIAKVTTIIGVEAIVDQFLTANRGLSISSSALLICASLVVAALGELQRRHYVARLATDVDTETTDAIEDQLMLHGPHGRGGLVQDLLGTSIGRAALDRQWQISRQLFGALAALEFLVLLVGVALFSPFLGLGLGVAFAVIAAFLIPNTLRGTAVAAETAAARQRACDRIRVDLEDGREALQAAGAEHELQQRLIAARASHAEAVKQRDMHLAKTIALLLMAWLLCLVVFAAIGVFGSTAIATGSVAALLLLALLLPPTLRLAHMSAESRDWSRQMGRLISLLELQTRDRAARGRKPQTIAGLAGRLEAKKVTLYYGSPNAPAALRDVSLRIEPGEHVVVVGNSGSGKSAVVQCLAGSLSPQKGRILIDDVDTRGIEAESLHRHLGVVGQSDHIFTASVTANIALGDESPDLPRVQQAARDAGLHETIKELPSGYDTPLGPGGWSLSAGQRRALCLARSLYRQPDVLLLDEPTRGMDIEQQTLVWENIKSRFTGRTVVLVTQQLHLARGVDRIFVLDRGHIVETGSHEQLMARNGLYYHMWLRVDAPA